MKTTDAMNVPRRGATSPTAGSMMFGMMGMMGALAVLGVTAYSVTFINTKISGRHKRKTQSFMQAEAGVQYVKARINEDLLGGAVSMDQPFTFDDSNLPDTAVIEVNYPAPPGFDFDPVTQLFLLPSGNRMQYTVTGRSLEANTTIMALLGRENLLGFIGIFGDREVCIQPNFSIYSYDSSVTVNPTPGDTTGKARLGSNVSIIMQPNTQLDGSALLGEDTFGNPGTFSGPSSIEVEYASAIPVDPLGARGGALAESFAYYSEACHNNNADAGISGNKIDLGSHGEMTLNSGRYYLEDFNMGARSTLTVQATPEDPVVIYLAGGFRAQPKSFLVSTDGSPRSFYLFSNASDEIRIQPNSEVRSFIYAPYAPVRGQPGGDFYGGVWAGSVQLQPNGDFFIDTRALGDWVSKTVKIVEWKEVL